MRQMAVNLAGVELKNPVMTASGTFGSGAEYGEMVDLNKLGAVVTKGVANVPWPGNPTPRIAEVYGGMINAIGLQNPGYDLFASRDIPFLRQYDTKIIVNVCGKTTEDYVDVVEKLASQPVDMLEINISCPNVKEGGIAFGQDPKAVEAITREVKRHAKQPIIMKLSPNVTDITEMAKAAEAGGADVLSLINTLTGMKIDINRRTFAVANRTGGLSGPAVKPVAVRMVYQVAQAVKLPIIGMGGIIKNPEYFITTVREGSISKAAEKLYLSQPYLSQCIARTEKELGVKLFDRSHMPLKLTEAGKIYMRYLESVGVLTGQFEEQLGELKTGRSRTLNVGMTLWRGSVLLPDILPSYSESHPDVRITLREHHTAQLSKLLQEDQIDFALMNMPLNLDDFVYDTVFNERLLLVASKDHPAIRGLEAGTPDHPLPIDMKKLRRERFILLQEDQVMGHAMKNLFAKMNMEPKDALYTTSSTTSVNLAARGFGITFLPEGGIRHTAHVEQLAFFTVDNPPFSVPLLLLYKKNSIISPHAKDFIDMVKEYYRNLEANKIKE